ncbi:virion morphogenesis protein [Caldovatus sediminis]|uniref:Virion morphogenesis protein n=1 Tax=Caldovatus sediminis TaxID=2041189 RepID=A0A8J2ZB38_9PROT|nr:phage minor head protein [Caldovatus sediminis]GGG30915.1 virion morphogenesis protein [Caldovatus sediminis]
MSGSTAATGTAAGIGLPFREAIAFFLQKTNTPTRRWTDVWRAAHSRSFMVAGAASDALLADFRAEIARALEQGTTLAEFRTRFDEIVARHGWVHAGAPGWRARIIYETNLSTAYSAGRYAQMTEPETLAAYPYWQYVHSRARHPRRQHQAWDGLVLRADDPFWKTHYPPNGWRCGCRVRPLSARGLARQGRSGPDTAPPVVTRPWTNPSTGRVEQVPEGIDPGFDYNPGEAWRGPPEIPGGGRWQAPPRGYPPPAPEPLPPPASAPGETYRAWLARREAAGFRPDGSVQPLGELPQAAVAALAARGRPPATTAVAITAEQLRHLARDAKARAGKAIPLADLRRLPELVAAPEAVLIERRTGALLLVFTPSDPALARVGKLVVHLDFVAKVREGTAGGARRARLFNGVKSGGLVDPGQLRRRSEYEVIDGRV